MRRGKSIKVSDKVNNVVTNETRLLISSRCKGISVKVFNNKNNFINLFPTITNAALHFCVNYKTICMIYKIGKLYGDFTYKF